MIRKGRREKVEKIGILLEHLEQGPSDNSSKTKIFQALGEVVLIFFSAYIGAMCFLSGFNIEVNKGVFIIGLSIMTWFHYGSFILKKKWRVISILKLALYFFLGFLLRRELVTGFLFIAKQCCRGFNEYYGTNYYIIWEVFGNEIYYVTVFMLGFFMVFLGILTGSLFYRFRRLLYLVSTFPFVVVPILIGVVPKSSYFAGYIILLMGIMGGHIGKYGSKERKVRLRISFVIITTGLCVFYVSSMVFTPVMYQKEIDVVRTKHKIQSQIEEISKKGFWEGTFLNNWLAQDKDKATGGLNGGKLGRTKEVVFANDINIRLYADKFPEGKLYLRGYIGTLYKGEHWEAMEEKPLSSWNKGVLYNMDIEILNNENRGILAPYGTTNLMEVKDDGFIQLSGEKVTKRYTVEYFVETANIQKVLSREVDSIDELSEGQDIYMEFPESSQIAMEWKNRKISQGDSYVKNAIKSVKEYLKKETKYSLSPGSLPEGEDFIDYFLFTKKTGYCTHYASTATIIFRMLGIPARYVEGYVVDTRVSEKTSLLQTISIRDTNAHAWTEIYIDDIGWMPIETTPGYTEGNVMPDEIVEQQKKKDHIETPTPTLSPEQTVLPVDKSMKKGINTEKRKKIEYRKEIQKFFGICFIIMGLLLAIFYFRWKVLQRKCKKIMGSTNINTKVLYLYKQVSRGLEFCDIVYEDNKEDFINAVESRFTFLQEGSFRVFFDIILKARFSPHGITRQEEEEVLKFYREYKEGMIQYGSGKEKIAFRYYL